ncbi:YqzE family protein [Novibacillus thermophilus]|jgi:hypothetical protein|uniref:YqzE family protein n=1 Tax=Novibacillus thermophilus TaxID=1471761 RepID=A0A1U9K946_9BACL|nr:YqzE family protein [Novibacillus thermophilus]AQS56541.1 hypothetical protein B0W44_13005 [Novibacillus thermophilus]
MSSNDYVQYLTERFVRYLETPREERKMRRKDRQRNRWSRVWFGDLLFGLHMFWQNRKNRRKRNVIR